MQVRLERVAKAAEMADPAAKHSTKNAMEVSEIEARKARLEGKMIGAADRLAAQRAYKVSKARAMAGQKVTKAEILPAPPTAGIFPPPPGN